MEDDNGRNESEKWNDQPYLVSRTVTSRGVESGATGNRILREGEE